MNDVKRTIRAARVNLKNVLMSPNFTIAALLLFVVLFAEITENAFTFPWRQTNPNGYGEAYYFRISLNVGYYVYAAPLACAFASSALFIQDWEAGFYRSRLMRSGKGGYANGLWLGATAGGGLALFMGGMLFALVCAVVYPPHIPAVEQDIIVAGFLGNFRYMLECALMAFLFGAVWSGVGLIFSVLSPSRYVSYLAPFILCFCSLLFLPEIWGPTAMLKWERWTEFPTTGPLAYQAALYAGGMLLFRFAFERRVIHGRG